jgi:hypothetical protein
VSIYELWTRRYEPYNGSHNIEPATDEQITQWSDAFLEYYFDGEPVIGPLILRILKEKERAEKAEAERDEMIGRYQDALKDQKYQVVYYSVQ